ncbi:hypothetical protein KMW28_27135 [Flammeovirga yaeyamensis]|uniref:Uncharacterized protein n=1 Tax=Flammeovirga yaeyamensis TaxID=367791 RepID=A0AAX1NAI8_9BACT|nr:hypothetical protein [Flammeovirga yaeyamensis]MBB3700045.1 hypothetical protein [Flammeovirga yaeyamensis]NMF37518.1 hypothetical protein [Flammeovirga yaeyamensis]QWG04575.1 hypothetical protein KMW28_27135 [Flammeovirga yaeyamensis]
MEKQVTDYEAFNVNLQELISKVERLESKFDKLSLTQPKPTYTIQQIATATGTDVEDLVPFIEEIQPLSNALVDNSFTQYEFNRTMNVLVGGALDKFREHKRKLLGLDAELQHCKYDREREATYREIDERKKALDDLIEEVSIEYK